MKSLEEVKENVKKEVSDSVWLPSAIHTKAANLQLRLVAQKKGLLGLNRTAAF